MGENTAIAWTTHSFNAWVGCKKVSPACAHCYAEAWAKRTGHPELWGDVRRRTSEANWRKPLKWDKEAKAKGERARVFCSSLSDVFEDHPAIQEQWRQDLFHLIAKTPNLDWLLLTKRPENAVAWLPWVDPHMFPYGGAEPWSNVWIGTTVENQQMADERIPQLLTTPAAVRFLSCEPILGPINLRSETIKNVAHQVKGLDQLGYPPIDWVIAGGESGPGYRSMNLDWARSLRDQCIASGTAFFFKQESGLKPGTNPYLDGVQWHQMPQVNQ